MALIFTGSSCCSICGQVLEEHQQIMSWSAFLDSDHELWKYSDTGMHLPCFESWEHKQKFEHLYQYQPTIDLEEPYLKEQINKHGIPPWLQKIIDYRKSLEES